MGNESTGLAKFEYSRLFSRERVLTSFAGRLAQSRKVLWYLETLVLSARYFQRIPSMGLGAGKKNTRFSHREKLWRSAVVPFLSSKPTTIQVAEFGVAYGRATAWWHQNLKNIEHWDGFDTFEGLPTPWTRGGVTVMDQGVFAPEDLTSPFPRIEGARSITWHKGLISDTISELSRTGDLPMFVLIDVDLLEPTRDVLKWMEVNGKSGDCIYFDEAFDPFNEGLALSESISRGLKFEVLGYTGSALCVVLV